MIYTSPFVATSKALYAALNSSLGIEWFDSAVPMAEITDHFKNQERFEYGVFGESDADCADNKDTAVWTSTMNLEIYSNYRGRKRIAETLEKLLNYLSSDEGWKKLAASFVANGFTLVSIKVGRLHINLPIYSDIGIWQSGETQIEFILNQQERS